MPNEEELEAIRKLEPLRKLIEEDKLEDFDPLPLGDKERAERLEGMVDRMSEKIVGLQAELSEYKALYNNVAKELNSANYLILQIKSLLLTTKA